MSSAQTARRAQSRALSRANAVHRRVDANRIVQQAHRATHRRVWPRDARDRDAQPLDAAEVVSAEIEVEELLGDGERAFSGLAKREEGQRVEPEERDVLGQLELAMILLEIRALQGTKRELQFLARGEALLGVVPIAVLRAIHQKREIDHNSCEPLKEIVAEQTMIEALGSIVLRCRHKAKVHALLLP